MATKVITGANTRWSYANVWEPKAMEGGKPKFSVSLIIPKSDSVTVGKIRAAIEEAYRDGQSKLKGNGKSVPALSTLRTPLRDGDLERPDDPAYANSYFVNANSASAPGVVDANRNEILDQHQLLCIQCQWEPWYCLRTQQSAEDQGRRTFGRQGQCRERLCYRA